MKPTSFAARFLAVAAHAALMLLSPDPASADARYGFTDLGASFSGATRANAINDLGQIVGEHEVVAGQTEGWFWNKGQSALVQTPSSTRVRLTELNESGQAVGAYGIFRGEVPFVWSAAGLVRLRGLELYTTPVDINDAGIVLAQGIGQNSNMSVVGLLNTDTPLEPPVVLAQFAYAAAINNSGLAIGRTTFSGGGPVAWPTQPTLQPPFALPNLGDPIDVNDRGQVLFNGFSQSTVWADGVTVNLGVLAGALGGRAAAAGAGGRRHGSALSGGAAGRCRHGTSTQHAAPAILAANAIAVAARPCRPTPWPRVRAGPGFDRLGAPAHGSLAGPGLEWIGFPVREAADENRPDPDQPSGCIEPVRLRSPEGSAGAGSRTVRCPRGDGCAWRNGQHRQYRQYREHRQHGRARHPGRIRHDGDRRAAAGFGAELTRVLPPFRRGLP